MRTVFALLFATLAVPALSADWLSYSNDLYGYSLDVPADYLPQGDANDGQVFESPDTTRTLLVWGGYLVEGDFATELANRKAGYEADGWAITYEASTPTWVSFSGTMGGKVLYVRAVSGCGGQQYAMFDFQYGKGETVRLDPVVDHMVQTLRQTRC